MSTTIIIKSPSLPVRIWSKRLPQSTRRIHTGQNTRKEGDISSVFVSLSGAAPSALPNRFAEIKRAIINGREAQIGASWDRLLRKLAIENVAVAQKGSSIIPQIEFGELENPSSNISDQIKERGVAVIRGVIPEQEARAYKDEIEQYVKVNPWTKAFPADDPQVFELYWSPPQVRARSHSNLIAAQRFLMNLWHSNSPDAPISTSQPLAYADRVRIRQPGDTGFALGPHVDGGSVERWEPDGYGRGGVYNEIWQGEWEKYDPWETSSRVPVISDLYEGAGACSMFRMFQGWLSMSRTGPEQGTLMVNPLLQLSTAYCLLRPFFEPIERDATPVVGQNSPDFLHPGNWRMKEVSEMTSELQGANPGHAQELNRVLHPHLELEKTMVHVPDIKPGDYVVWHCDTIHAVDKVHMGQSDSSVLYIPVCPVTEKNAEYLKRQRTTFLQGLPGPDFPGGKGESEHSGRPTDIYLERNVGPDGLRAMGMERLSSMDWVKNPGGRKVIQRANAILGFA